MPRREVMPDKSSQSRSASSENLPPVVRPFRSKGLGRFLFDAASVFEINFIPFLKHWYITVLLASGTSLPWFYVTRAIAPDDPQVIRRLMAGTLVFGVTFSIGMLVGQNAVAQRFTGSLRLLVTMPMSKGSYVLGSLVFSSISGTVTVLVLLGFGLATGIGINPTWTLAPSLVLAVLTMAGLTMFVVSFAPSLQVGNLSTGLLSLALAALSPVYFTLEQAPLLLKFLGYVSPLRYAADAIEKSLSGRVDVWSELGVLAAFALVTMSLGLWRLPWREQ